MATTTVPCFIVTIYDGDNIFQNVVDTSAFSVGRSLDVTLQFTDPNVSRHHLDVFNKKGKVYIEDKGTANGTYINGQKIQNKTLVEINSEDKIKLGNSKIVLNIIPIDKVFNKEAAKSPTLDKANQQRVLELVTAAEDEARRLLTTAQAQSDNLLKSSQSKAQTLVDEALVKKEEIETKAAREIAEKKKQIEETLNYKKIEAENAIAQKVSEQEHILKQRLAEFEKQLLLKKQTAESDLAEWKQDAEQKLHLYYQNKLDEVNKKIDSDKSKIESDFANYKESIKSEADKLNEKIREANEKRVLEAKKEAESIIKKAQRDAHEMVLDAQQKSENLIDHAEQVVVEKNKIASEELENIKQQRIEHENNLSFLKEEMFKANQSMTDLKVEYTKTASLVNLKKEEFEQIINDKNNELDVLINKKQEELNKIASEKQKQIDLIESDLKNKQLSYEKDLVSFKIASEELAKINIELELVTKSYEKTKTDYDHVKSDFDEILPQFKEAKEFIAQFSNQKSKLESEIDALKKQNEVKKGELFKVQDEIESESKRHKAIKEQTQQLMAQYEQTEESNKKIIEDYNKLTEDYNKNNDDYKLLIAKKDELAQLIVKRGEENKKLSDMAIVLTREIDSKKMILTDLEYSHSKTVADLKQKHELEKSDLIKSLEEHLQNQKADYDKKYNEYIEQMNLHLQSREKEFVDKVVDNVVQNFKNDGVQFSAQKINESVKNSFSEVLASMSTSLNQVTKAKHVYLERSKYYRNLALQFSFGAIVFGSSYFSYNYLSNKTLDSQINESIQASQMALEQRKFAPEQVDEIKDNYTDSVIYTKSFVEKYSDESYQIEFSKATQKYFLENWRLPEETSIEVTSAVFALVKTLNEKRQAIHPDFVDKNIASMKEQEAEIVTKLEEKLGSSVKYQAFKRFEKKYFETHVSF